MQRKLTLGLVALALLLPSAGVIVPAAAASNVLPGQVPNEIIVSYRGSIPADTTTWATTQGATELLRDDVLHWVSFRLADAQAADRAIASAMLRGDVRIAERDGYMHSQFTPSDPLYAVQADWPAINAPAAWDITRGSHSVVVADIDTGVYYQHPDLAANFCGPAVSFVPSESGNFDGFGHGTHVAGTIAAVSGNGIGGVGAGNTCLMSVKALNSGGSGQWSWGAAAIRYAADNGADIESMSWGGSLAPTILGDAVFYAYNTKNVLLVAAAGNAGCSRPETEIFPAIYQDVLAVAALNENGIGIAGFSSCGLDVEIAAPGANVLSTMRPCSAPICSNSGYGRISGTSMATPHVSGVAALVKAVHPGLDGHGLRCAIDLSATDQGLPGHDYQYGWGRLDARGALDEAASLIAQFGSEAQVNTACTALDTVLGAGGIPDAPTPVTLPI